MTDLSNTILAKTDQLNADDLQGKTITIKITKVTGVEGEQPIVINFEGDNGKPYKPGKSMRRVLAKVWGVDGKLFVGRSLTLYCDPLVKFGGLEVGGIRISHMSHLDKPVTMALTASKANKKPFTVKPLAVAAVDDETTALVAQGNLAASEGVAKYSAWKDALTPEQKTKIKSHHAEWSKTAKAADESVVVEEEGPGI